MHRRDTFRHAYIQALTVENFAITMVLYFWLLSAYSLQSADVLSVTHIFGDVAHHQRLNVYGRQEPWNEELQLLC